MANIQFRYNKGLKVKDPFKPHYIYLRYRIGAKVDFQASIGFSVLFNDWNFEKEIVRNKTTISERFQINNLITNLRTHFNSFDNDNKVKGFTPSYGQVKEHYKDYFTESIESKEVTLLSFVDEFIDDAKSKPNPITKKLVRPNTIKGYITTKNKLKAFNDEVYKIDFDTITLEWYYDFNDWCNIKGYKMNTTGMFIKTLKTFMNSAVDKELTNNLAFRSKKFSVYREETDSIYLNEKELKEFWHLDLSNTPRKEIARDLFLLGAYTGLRVSDFNNINKDSIKVENGVKMLKLKTEKTGKVVAIPMHPVVNAILNKNNGQPPQRIPDQHINELIKEVAKTLELNERVELNYNRSGHMVTEFKFKHELVTNHTARRSFCTNAYLSNMNTDDIMALSGHTTYKNFRKYIKVSAEETAIRMSEHSFFTNTDFLLKRVK